MRVISQDTEIHQKLYDPLPLGCKSICLFDCCHSATVANLSETMVVEQGPVTADMKEALVTQRQRRFVWTVRWWGRMVSHVWYEWYPQK